MSVAEALRRVYVNIGHFAMIESRAAHVPDDPVQRIRVKLRQLAVGLVR